MRIVMMGTGTFAEPTFQALLDSEHEIVGLVTQPDREAGSRRGSTRQVGVGMKRIALDHQIPVFQPESINTPEGIAGLEAWKPELLVVAAYGQILSDEVLNVPPQGGINVHASLLPKYRGAAPIAWAIYHGETETGVTVIRMSTKLDAGEMLAQESVIIDPQETAGELEARLAPLGAELALDVIRRMGEGPVRGEVQEAGLVTRAPKLKKHHGLMDWTRPAKQVCDQVRAMHPWPTAFTFWHQTGEPLRMIVHRAEATDLSTDKEPGQVLPDPDRFLVAVGEGEVVEIHELQPAGKRRMPASDLLRGRKPQEGDRLGPQEMSS